MMSLSFIRQAANRAPALARAASSSTARPYSKPTSYTAYRRATPAAKPTAAKPVAATPTPEPLPVEDDVPDEVVPSPAEYAVEHSLELAHSSPSQDASAAAAANWVQPGVGTSQYPSAQWQQFAQPPEPIDWTTSFHGLSARPFSKQAAETLMRPLVPAEIEIKPDGLLYLPEILYRRILNQAFGPGGWGMVPRGEMTVTKNMVSREWALLAGGRLVAVSRGEQTYFDPSGVPTASEGCKSNALMRCCKDLGIASELWDPAFIRVFKAAHCVEAWTEHSTTKKKQKRWRKKGNKFEYPLVEPK